MHFRDTSGDGIFPKTLLIRNVVGGMIWQTYHVNNFLEAEFLSLNAYKNGFEDRELASHQPSRNEDWPGWRDTLSEELRKKLKIIN